MRILIVGGSLAGVRTAESLRESGFPGEIMLLEAEPGIPYDRPPLSKDVLAAPRARADIALCAPDSLRELGIRLVDGCRAVSLDLGDRSVSVSDGEAIGFDTLVIATGASARRLPCDSPHIAHLRTFDDAARIRGALDAGCRLVVIGAGFIGAEVAAAARMRGLPVTMVEAADAPLARVLGEEIGTLLGAMHLEQGVDLRCGVKVTGIEGLGDASGVRLADGSLLPADLIVVGIGAVPNVGWLAGSGLLVEDGVVCDATCQAVGASGVYAVGDVARWWNARYGTHMRVEHWTNATEQGRAVAAAILGDPRPYVHVPYVWSRQYGHMIQVVGRPGAGMPCVRRPADGVRGLVAWYGQGDSVDCMVAVDQPRLIARARRVLAGTTAKAGDLAALISA